MMSLISAALICMKRISPRKLCAGADHLVGEAFKLRLHAAVVDGAAHGERDAADQLRVDLGRQHDETRAREALRERLERRELLRLELRRAADRHTGTPELPVDEALVG